MTVKTLIFDFDGLILETEYPIYKAIRDVYQQYGSDLPLDEYTYCVGGSEDNYHFLHLLEKKINRKLDINTINQRVHSAMMVEINLSQALPGVESVLQQAKDMKLQCLVASSSDFNWVNTHLLRLGLRDYFTDLCTAEDVQHVKPEPDLYLLALKKANVQANQAIVFEDSSNGIVAASRAGIFGVAVPNRITENLDFSKANLILKQIDEIPLIELIEKVKLDFH
ncbi:MAG: HAD-IA family hydrolase [Anaerolineaceae bacterium]|nr:HAD-IA family hydrolase [Anaerolineaceae bacterium]